ncbi:hypothetical protein B0H14DRAFT_2884898 [Mycena olivaceomarginata]|nr:hypothetical protein B0H14DRAFT_2884898 [Mycena olivaceomarginata]
MRLLALFVVASILAPAMAQSAAPSSTGCIVCPSVPACNCAENQQCVLTPRTCTTCAGISCTANDGPSSGASASAPAAPSSTGSALRSGVNSGIFAGVIVGLAALGLVR